MIDFPKPEIHILRKWILTFLLFFLSVCFSFSQQKIVSDSLPLKSDRDEIVNIGYGTQKKKEITSSIVSVKSDDFNKGNIQSPIELIRGKVAGLSISKAGGDPNGAYEIRLRGLNTINSNTAPLIIIDGMIAASLENVDPNDIESIDVLKDGSAAAIYGTRGSNGVIYISTRRGRSGAPVIEYNVYATAEMVARNNPAMSAAQWRALSAEVGFGNDYGTSTNWFKEIEQTALSQVHNISMSGGTDKTRYRASINYHNGNGILINTGYDQFNGRMNITQMALNDKLTLDLNLSATQRESKYGFAEAFKYASICNPTAPVKSSDPAYSNYDGYFQQVIWDYFNPVSIEEENKNEGKNRVLNMSLKGTYEIIRGLFIDAFYSRESTGSLEGQYFNSHDYWGGINRNGLASRQEDNSVSRLFESTLHYNTDLTSAINLSLLGGYSYQDFTNEGFDAQGGNFLTDNFNFNNLSAALDFKNGIGTLTSYKNSNKLVAFFGRVNLSLNNRWFLNASLRKEGSSRFGSNNKWGLFPSVGGGVDIAKSVGFIDYLKLRAGYGVTGNQPSESYLSIPQLDHLGNAYYDGTFIPIYSIVNRGNPYLKWEKKSEFDAGLDFSLLKSRLSGSVDFYTTNSKDLLYQYFIPSEMYYSYSWVWLNPGMIRSSGLELTINWNVLNKSDLKYKISFSPSFNLKNTLVSISGNYDGNDFKYGTQDLGYIGGSELPLVRVGEGKPLGQLIAWVFKEVDPTGKITLVDENNDGYINYSDMKVVGNGLPKFQFGFGNSLVYKNWELNVFFRGVFGHDLINSYRTQYEAPNMIYSYNLPVTAASMRNSATHTLMNTSSGVISSIDIENASFVSLDNMKIGYNFRLPESFQFSKIGLFIAGNNMFYLTKYKGSDPNPRYADSDNYYGTYDNPLVPGIDRLKSWPRTRSVTIGANVVF